MQRIQLLTPTRATLAVTLHEWHTALATATISEEAEVYACAVTLIMDVLACCETLPALLEAYYRPDRVLRYLVSDFCADGEIRLDPRLVIGAACALRLRQLVAYVTK